MEAILLNESPIKSQICYSLQYLEFLQFQICDETLTTDVVRTMQIKTFVIYAMEIIDGLFRYILKEKGKYPMDKKKLQSTTKSNETVINDKKYFFETHIYECGEFYADKVDFATVINRVHKKDLIGASERTFLIIKNLKELRNKVHLHLAEDYYESDYNSFGLTEFYWAKCIVHYIITNDKFCKNSNVFKYLKPTEEEIVYMKNNPVKQRTKI